MVPPRALKLDAAGVCRIPDWGRFEWLDCGFGTRSAGNWTHGPSVSLKQVHSNLVLRADGPGGRLGEADALVTNTSNVWLEVRTADCIPVLLLDEEREAVGVAHAGWRGTVSGIVERTLERMSVEFGTRFEAVHAAIGPGIGQCCFEVGPEVAVQFETWFPERQDLHDRTRIDLEETIARQLSASGVRRERIIRAGRCTRCHGAQFHSYRRDGDAAGRMVTAARIKTKGEAQESLARFAVVDELRD